jgi:hemerythrin
LPDIVYLVDPNLKDANQLKRFLTGSCKIVAFSSVSKAIEALDQKKHNPKLLIAELDLEHLPSQAIFEHVQNTNPECLRIGLSKTTEIQRLADALNHGQIQYFYHKSKPMQETAQKILGLLHPQANLEAHESEIETMEITQGVYWVSIPKANLRILCGCPADVVKHMNIKGWIDQCQKDDVVFETGPNAILLSEVLIQNQHFSNLAEFPILQMLYRQGMILPNHPNNDGNKPILIGVADQVKAQLNYIYRGNYGLNSKEEILKTGCTQKFANELMQLKLKFAFGKIKKSEELLDTCILSESGPRELKQGVFVERKRSNVFEISTGRSKTTIDLNLKQGQVYQCPYKLGDFKIRREYFGIIHSGEGDGWDVFRPSMSSILMYQGKIYLIDVGPNISYLLKALGIHISEVEGVFHTHAHDDHFSGLPTLLQADHRIKYYTTPLVRASVTKKLTALMSLQEKSFEDLFEIHDLSMDQWNHIDGLEVKPMFSPHPLETNIFLFRTLGEDGYRSYAHWADIVSFDVLKNMIRKKPKEPGISQTHFDKVKKDYLTTADLKKLDVGAGLIHGQAKDFKHDQSKKIILAHTSFEHSQEDKEIGSSASFGNVDVLIPARENYMNTKAREYLLQYFPNISQNELNPILNCPVVSFNPGSIIHRKGDKNENLFLILTGLVERIQTDTGLQNHVSNGFLIGEAMLYDCDTCPVTIRTDSHVYALKIPKQLYLEFLHLHHLYQQMKKIYLKVKFIQSSRFFGESLTYRVQNQIAQNLKIFEFKKGDKIPQKSIYLIKKGQIQLIHKKGTVVKTFSIGNYFGENSLFGKKYQNHHFICSKNSQLFSLDQCKLLEIPILHWKMLERHKRRLTQISQA